MKADTRSGAARRLDAGSENCLPVGTRLADFEITGVLGEGGFGIVYLAYDRALQRTVAIKEYMPGALATRAANGNITLRADRHKDTFRLGLKSFINEARLLARFDHPALIKVYRFWEQNNTAYTAMKFYDGRTIKDIVANTPELVDEAWCRKVLRQILGALGMLYTNRILHRDISPDNIIVQENGDAVLLDFGSARQIIGDMTRGMTVILKPGYAPVEQYAGDASLEQGQYTDLYSLSAVMYFAITKEPPPTSIGRMINDPIVPLTRLAPPGYSTQLLAAIDSGLAVLAQDRPQTIDAFRSLLGFGPLEPAPAPAPLPAAEPQAAPPASAPVAAAGPTTGAPIVDRRAPQPAPAAPAAMAQPASGQAKPAPGAPHQRLLIGAGAALLLGVAAAGYALFGSSSQDTAVLAQPPAPSASQPAAPAAPAEAAPIPARTDAAADGAAGDTRVTGADSLPPAEAAPSMVTLPATEAPGAVPKPGDKDTAAAPGATYKLRIKPWGTLYVDGKAAGVSPPLKQVALTPGKHEIRIVNPTFPDYVATIEVDKKPGTIEHDFSEP